MPANTTIQQIIRNTHTWGRMIKFEHSVFALPYAYLGAFLAVRAVPPLTILLWLSIAMAGIRSFAMTLNRLADLDLDRLNQRTSKRALVTGEISVSSARVFAFVSVAVYFAACCCMNRLILILSPVPVLVVIIYSWAKRYTWTTHFILGLCHAFAPMAGWLSVDPNLSVNAALFACALLFWTAGFDIIYSTQDVDFDTACNLHSAPAKFGVANALSFAAFCHAVFALFLFIAIWANSLGWEGWITWILVLGMLLWEHLLIKPDNLKRINAAFFACNAIIALIILAGVLVALFR